MKELYSIMRDFLEVEYNQKSLLSILKVLETAYNNEEQEEAKLISNSTKYYLESLQKELHAAINRLDTYIAKKQKDTSI